MVEVRRLTRDGICSIQGVLDNELTRTLLAEADEAASLLANLTPEELLHNTAAIHTRLRRHDIPLPLTPAARKARGAPDLSSAASFVLQLFNLQLWVLACSCQRMEPIIRSALSNDGLASDHPLMLVEFGAVTSQPQASSQTWHADVDLVGEDRGAARIFCVFLALHDVEPLMGPTEVLPRTHKRQFHVSVQQAAGVRGRSQRRHPTNCGPSLYSIIDDPCLNAMDAAVRLALKPPEYLTMRAGDAVIMDAASFHRGGANVSACRRTLLHFAVMDGGGARPPQSFTYTIVPEARAPFLLLEDVIVDPPYLDAHTEMPNRREEELENIGKLRNKRQRL